MKKENTNGNSLKIRLNGLWYEQKCSELVTTFCTTKVPPLILVELTALRIKLLNSFARSGLYTHSFKIRNKYI